MNYNFVQENLYAPKSATFSIGTKNESE